MILGAAIALASCGASEKSTGETFEELQEAVVGAASTSIWEASRTVDPMTDLRKITAIALFDADPAFNVNVTVECQGDQNFFYYFDVYDKSDDPAETPFGASVFSMRIDDQPAKKRFSMSRFTNQIEIKVSPYDLDGASGTMIQATDDSIAAAKASRLALRIPLRNGQVDVIIDQTDPTIRSVLDECIRAVEPTVLEEIRKRNADEERFQREKEAKLREREGYVIWNVPKEGEEAVGRLVGGTEAEDAAAAAE